MSTILSLAPQNVWKHFYSLTQIPRPSGHMEKVTEFLINFGKGLGLESFVDEAGNVIIRKPATPGMENRKGVILQAHMDMVPQKNNDTVHDFEKDPIETYIDGDWVKAKGTTLGADNGLGVAAIMAVLEANDLKHGPLEALITKDEETGMYGAFGLKPGTVNGEILLNLDSEDEGELYIGCAGGMDVTATLEYKEVAPEEGDVAVKVSLKGLRGGHSGLEINEGRANANKLLVRFVREAVASYEARLVSWDGGNMRNAIPREACAVLAIPAENEEELLAAIGSKVIILGEVDKNELKEKQTSNWKKYLTFSFGNTNKEKPEEKEQPQEKEKINPKQILKLTEESLQKKYIMAECCHPIPGDDVLGYVDENDRIIIHKRQCPVAAKLKSSYGNRILATEWDTHKELSFLVYIYIKGIDSMGLLNEVTQVISRQLNVNIRKLTIETNDGIFEGKIQLWVHDVEDVKTICNNLKKIQNIKQVNRVEE